MNISLNSQSYKNKCQINLLKQQNKNPKINKQLKNSHSSRTFGSDIQNWITSNIGSSQSNLHKTLINPNNQLHKDKCKHAIPHRNLNHGIKIRNKSPLSVIQETCSESVSNNSQQTMQSSVNIWNHPDNPQDLSILNNNQKHVSLPTLIWDDHLLQKQNNSTLNASLNHDKYQTNQDSVQFVSEYQSEIWYDFKQNEQNNIPDYKTWFETSTQITGIKRAILINWLSHIHLKFHLLPETFHLTINIIDRYTSWYDIDLHKYQLIGIVSLFIASKYEEIYPPEIIDFWYAAKNVFLRKEFWAMEEKILKAMQYDFNTVSSFRFLQYYYCINCKENKKAFYWAQYIVELCTMDINVMKYKPSLRAASALYMARKLMKINEDGNMYKGWWSFNLQWSSGYCEKDLTKCVKEIVCYLQIVLKNKSNSFRDKFSSSIYEKVALVFKD